MNMSRLIKIGANALVVAIGLEVVGAALVAAAPPPPPVTAPVTSPASELTAEDVNAWLDGLVPAALNSAEVPGAVVAVVKDGQVVTTRGYGYADVESRTPVTGDTLFQMASVSKIPTTIAALQLVEQGKLDLDADISTYVDVPIERKFDDPITLRNLLTHTAGFEERVGEQWTYGQNVKVDLEQDVTTDPPTQVYQPGTVPAYSNYGLILVGYIVQKVSGLPFGQYVADSVFTPAGMDSSTYNQPLPEDLADRMATGYVTTGEPGRGFWTGAGPAGALSSSGNDMAAFMNAQLGGTLLSPAMEDLAWNRGLESPFGGNAMGLGYFLGQRHGHETVWHAGDWEYFHSYMELYPVDNIGVFVAVNGEGVDAKGGAIRSTLLQGFADRYLNAPEAPTFSDPAAVERAKEVAGRYGSSQAVSSNWASLLFAIMPFMGSPITATEDGGLIAQGSTYMKQVSPWVWQDPTNSMTLSADPTRNSDHLLVGGAMTYLPASGSQTFTFVGLVTALVSMLLVLLAWPLGALRRYGRLTWTERFARLGMIAWPLAIFYLASALGDFYAISTTSIRVAQGLAVMGALAITPAAWSLVRAVRGRVGWARYATNSLVLLELIFMMVIFAMHHVFNPDISF